jgi:hypothetical protein
VHRGIYAVGHVNLPLEGRLLAAVKACGPGAVLSHYSAAALWGFVDWDDRYPEVTVVGTSTRLHRGLRVHRTSQLDRRDTFRHRGIPVTSPAWTLMDLASQLDYRRLPRAVRQAQSLRRVSIPHLVDVLGRLGARRGSRKLARIVATGPAWHDNKLAREDDAERQALLEAHGERVLRVTWDQAIALPGQTLARIRAAGVPLALRASSS